MKNWIISFLTTYIIIGMDFWIWGDMIDKVLAFSVLAVMIFIAIDSIDDHIRKEKKRQLQKRRRAEQFAQRVSDLTERKA